MTRKDITDKIFFVSFDSKVEAAKTFCRFQEHYESPEFKGKIFSLLEFARYYKKENGSFSYYKDWSGFNIPSYVLAPFYDGRFKNLSKREKAILDMFKEDVGDFYIIACQGDKILDLEHEIMHGLYYTNEEYRQDVEKLLARQEELFPETVTQIYDIFEEEGYDESVFRDELHAYLCDFGCHEFLESCGMSMEKLTTTASLLKMNYDRYMRNYV